jgi:hypothetical protein
LDIDLQLQFALARAMEIVGEAASRLSQDFRARQSDIPWPLIISMRDRLAHAYFDLDNDSSGLPRRDRCRSWISSSRCCAATEHSIAGTLYIRDPKPY